MILQNVMLRKMGYSTYSHTYDFSYMMNYLRVCEFCLKMLALNTKFAIISKSMLSSTIF